MTSSSSAGGRSRSASAARVSCEPRGSRRQGGRRRLVLIATAAALFLGGEGTQAKDQAQRRHGRQPGRRSDADGTWRATADAAAEAGPPRRRIPNRLDQLDPERVVTAEDAAMADGLAPPYRRRDQDRRVAADRTDGGHRRTGERASSAARREYSAELRNRRQDEGEGEGGEGEGASLVEKDALVHRSLQNDKQQDQKADKNNDKNNDKDKDKDDEDEAAYDPLCSDSSEVFFYKDNSDEIYAGTCVSVAASLQLNPDSNVCRSKIASFDPLTGKETDEGEDGNRRVGRSCQRTCGRCQCPPEDEGGCDVDNVDPIAGGVAVESGGGGGGAGTGTDPPELTYSAVCSPSAPCPRCTGNCAGSSSHCASGLVCLSLEGGFDTSVTFTIPGCAGAASGATGWDYCVRPEDAPSAPTDAPAAATTTTEAAAAETAWPTSDPTTAPASAPTTESAETVTTATATTEAPVGGTEPATEGTTTTEADLDNARDPEAGEEEVEVAEPEEEEEDTSATTPPQQPEENTDVDSPGPADPAPELEVRFGFATRDRLYDYDGWPIPIGDTGHTRVDYIKESLAHGLSRVAEGRLDRVDFRYLWLGGDVWEKNEAEEANEGGDGGGEGRRRRRRRRRTALQLGVRPKDEWTGTWMDGDDGGRRLSEGDGDGDGHGEEEEAMYVIEFDWHGSEIVPLELQDGDAVPPASSNRNGGDVDGAGTVISAVLSSTQGTETQNLEIEDEDESSEPTNLGEAAPPSSVPPVVWHSARLVSHLHPSESSPIDAIGSALANAVRLDLSDAVAVSVADGSMAGVLKDYTGGKIVAVSRAGMEGFPIPDDVLYAPTSEATSREEGGLYQEQLDPGVLDPIRVAGFVLFAAVVLGAVCGLKVATRRRNKRMQRETWGTMLKSDNDLNKLLSVGLVMSMSDEDDGLNKKAREENSGLTSGESTQNSHQAGVGTKTRPLAEGDNGGESSGGGSGGGGAGPQPKFEARVYDEEEMGYSKDNSMLMGGYQRTAEILTMTDDGGVELSHGAHMNVAS